jgi:Icc protein
MILCQISDLHLKTNRKLAYGVVDTASHLERCVSHVNALKQLPDLVVVTGDLVDRGELEEYGLLRELLSPLRMPYYLLLGNHDNREAFRESFGDCDYVRKCEHFVQYTIEDWPLRVVALDTHVPGSGGGDLCAQRLDWLDHTLGVSDRPTVVAQHHPPFLSGIGYMDRLLLKNIEGLERVIARHPQVERVLCGHLHRPITARFGSVTATTCPAPAHQIPIDLNPESPGEFIMEPPGYQLHYWNGTGLITHTAFVGEFQGPFPFRAAGKQID